MIDIKGLTKRYGSKVVLDGIDLAVADGEIVGLLGPNGAGKSTLMKCLVGLVHSDQGQIRIDGNDMGQDRRKSLARLGFVPQRVAFPPHLTVEGVVAFYAGLKQLPAAAAEAALAKVGLAVHRHKRVGTLSGGMLQRLGLAQALLAAPPLLILDEPTVGLDPHVSLAFRDLLAELNGQGATILIASHLLSEVERLAHRVAILKEGRMLALDRIDRLMAASGLPISVRIRPGGPLAAARDSLGAAGISAEPVDGALHLAEADGPAAMAALCRLGIPIERFWTVSPTLEEVFRLLVEKGAA